MGRVLEHSDPLVITFFFLVFCISTIAFCFMISVFFTRANLAAVCGGILYFGSYLPYTICARWEEYMTVSEKALSVSQNLAQFSLKPRLMLGFNATRVAIHHPRQVIVFVS